MTQTFHILTLFPEFIENYAELGIVGRAHKNGLIRIRAHQLRDWASDKHGSVDDRPYGGGSGMVMRPDVIVGAVRTLRDRYDIDHVIHLSPRGIPLNQLLARERFHLSSVLLICGRYEGVDQRALDLVVDEEISIGDYVISGGELAALVYVDVMARLVPDVLGNERATAEESYSQDLLEYPHYTRPEVFEGLQVPEVLLSGHHEEIRSWREAQAHAVTIARRPDLLKDKQK